MMKALERSSISGRYSFSMIAELVRYIKSLQVWFRDMFSIAKCEDMINRCTLST